MRNRDKEALREALDRAFMTSLEAEYYISRSYDEFRILHGKRLPDPGSFLGDLLTKFEGHFGITTHEDLKAPLDVLEPSEFAAVYQATAEAFWNVTRTSDARNVYLESRLVGSVLLVRIRDDGRGLEDGHTFQGLQIIRQRVKEAGADMDVISKPGRGTTVQLRFNKK
ncbi:MAG: sensor histidine kinase [Rubrobacteraceae bacterium]